MLSFGSPYCLSDEGELLPNLGCQFPICTPVMGVANTISQQICHNLEIIAEDGSLEQRNSFSILSDVKIKHRLVLGQYVGDYWRLLLHCKVKCRLAKVSQTISFVASKLYQTIDHLFGVVAVIIVHEQVVIERHTVLTALKLVSNIK